MEDCFTPWELTLRENTLWEVVLWEGGVAYGRVSHRGLLYRRLDIGT